MQIVFVLFKSCRKVEEPGVLLYLTFWRKKGRTFEAGCITVVTRRKARGKGYWGVNRLFLS